MKMAPFTEFIVYLNISLLLGVIDSLTNQRGAGDVIASIRESSLLLGKKYEDNNNDSDLYKISSSEG